MRKKKIEHYRNSSSNSNNIVGLEIGKYRLGTLLGQGAFGTVHSGLDIVSGDIVAIKKISVPHESLNEIKSEVSSLLHLAHQHIVEYIDEPIYNIDPTNATVYICMEYMEGGSLADMIKKYGPMSPDLAKNCFMQSLSGLEYLHTQGVIHRDIKGKNILSTKNGLVKLADFGCAFFKAGQDTNELAAVAGSPFWMAPEIIEQTSSPTTACDIWSLGCTLIEVLTGKPPYATLEPMSALYHMCSDERLLDHVDFPLGASDPVIIAFLEMCLQKQPDRRAKATDLLTAPFFANTKAVRRSSGKIGGEGERRKSKTKNKKSTESNSRNNSNERNNDLLLNTNNLSDRDNHNATPTDDYSKESSFDNTTLSNNAPSNTDAVLQENNTAGSGSGVISLTGKSNTRLYMADGRPRVSNSSALATHVSQAREMLELIIRHGSQVTNRARSKKKSLYVYDEETEEEIENVCGRNAQSLCRRLKARPGLASAIVSSEGVFSIGRLVKAGSPGLRVLSALCSRSPLLQQQIGGSGILRVLLNQLDTGITVLMEVDPKESIKELEVKKNLVQNNSDTTASSTLTIRNTDAQNLQQDNITNNNGCLPIGGIFSCFFGNVKSITNDDKSGDVITASSPSPVSEVIESIVLVTIPSSLVEAARLVREIAITNNASLRMLADAGGMSVICKMLGIYRILPWKSLRSQIIDDMILEPQSMDSPLSHNGVNLISQQTQFDNEYGLESQIKTTKSNHLNTDTQQEQGCNLTDTQLEWERELASSAFGSASSQKPFTGSIADPTETFSGRDGDGHESSVKSQLENISHRRVLSMVRMALECLERFLHVATTTTTRNMSSDNSLNSRTRPDFSSAGVSLETATDLEIATDISSLPPISGGVRESVNLLLEYDIPKLLVGALYRYQQEYMVSVTNAASHRRHLYDTNTIEVHSGSETDEDRNSVENGLRYKTEAGLGMVLGLDDDSTSESGLDLGDRDREREDSATPEGFDTETTSPTLGLNLGLASRNGFHEGDESESDRENHNVAFIYSGHGHGNGFDCGSAASVCSDLSEDPSLSDFSALNDQNMVPAITNTITSARDNSNSNFQLRKIMNMPVPQIQSLPLPPVAPTRPRASEFSRSKYVKDSTGISISRLRKQCRQITEMIWALVGTGPSTGVCEALCQELQDSEYNVNIGLSDFNGGYFGENQQSSHDELERIDTPLGAMLSCVTGWNDRMRWALNAAHDDNGGGGNIDNNYEYIASEYWSELASYAGTVLNPLLGSMYTISERPVLLQCFEDESAIRILIDLLRCSNDCTQIINRNSNDMDRDKDRVDGSSKTMERSCRKIQTQTMRVLYNLCHLSTRRQEQAIREGLILDLITLYNTNKALGNSGMNNSIIRHVIFILCDLAYSPTCCKTLVHQGGIVILGDILAESYESKNMTDERKNKQKIKEEFHAGSLVLLAISAIVAESDNALPHLVDFNPHNANQSSSIGSKIIEFISIRLELELEYEDQKQKGLSNDLEILTKPTILYMIQKLGDNKPEIEGAKILQKKLQTKLSEVREHVS